ncbi:MAG: heme ABC transporter substrate-binding protein IsdE [Adlercreutzia sp.]|nr:heme ABC transporter substrate-binding protein IsdE [Adlercreutzia sp.]
MRSLGAALALAAALCLSSCVDQYPDRGSAGEASEPAVAVTSPVVAEICDRLHANVVGVPQTTSDLPEAYAQATVIGGAMAPDLEVLSTLHADYVFTPLTLVDDLQPKYASIGQPSLFLDLKSVPGLYDSVDYAAALLGREAEAAALRAEYDAFVEAFRQALPEGRAPRVLVLMGVPGSYVVATDKSYVGSLVELAGGENVYGEEAQEFVNVNAEDMAARDPDIILRACHGLPDEVTAMFAEEFQTNDIWRHFRAVQEGRVYDLPSDLFGMSATFDYPEALSQLSALMYQEGDPAW